MLLAKYSGILKTYLPSLFLVLNSFAVSMKSAESQKNAVQIVNFQGSHWRHFTIIYKYGHIRKSMNLRADETDLCCQSLWPAVWVPFLDVVLEVICFCWQPLLSCPQQRTLAWNGCIKRFTCLPSLCHPRAGGVLLLFVYFLLLF